MPSSSAFQIQAPFAPAGDQPAAIQKIIENFKKGKKQQTLLGVTGSGKTFTMAHIIQKTGLPALALAPNKTLAGQLFGEFKELFPKNAVEYFVSYYDYYQPEAYIPATNTYIEKDASINEWIDLMRHSATRSLLERQDVIIVSSVSCIYGLGSPELYSRLVVELEKGARLRPQELFKRLAGIQYQRRDRDFSRGSFRARGDTVEIFPAYEESRAVKVEFFGSCIDSITITDPYEGTSFREVLRAVIYPASHYVSEKEQRKRAVRSIKKELKARLQTLALQNKALEKERLEKRTLYDLEMMEETGSCSGIENYSRHLTGRKPGAPPPTLLEYFPKNFLMFIDESHISVPQAGGMFRGDRRRKETLVEHGFRLPSALDNRPLNFQEFEGMLGKVVYVSATPGAYELQKSGSAVVEQIIRPTGLLDPEISVRPASRQVKDLLLEIQKRVQRKERVLVTVLTKKTAESLTEYYQSLNIRVQYLHGDIKTLERTEILQSLRAGDFDVLVGINLLREGLDLPEVSLVAVLDADQEGFLRSAPSLIQVMGRAARHIKGRAILYAEKMTRSMSQAIAETKRRRKLQKEHNARFNIQPRTIKKVLGRGLMEMYGFASEKEGLEEAPSDPKKLQALKTEMRHAANALDFEKAARLRDRIKALQLKDLENR